MFGENRVSNTNQGIQLVSTQLSFSTDEIERSVFFDVEETPLHPKPSATAEVTLLVVNGELFMLAEGPVAGAVEFGNDAALLDLIGVEAGHAPTP